MEKNINVYYIYVIILIIIFTYLYFVVEKHNKRPQYISHAGSKVLVEINSNVVAADAKNIYNHMQLIKENLNTVNRMNFSHSQDVNVKINNLVKISRDNLQTFKDSNNYVSVGDDISDYYDSYKYDISESKINLADLITDIEITMLLLKKHTNGHILLTNLHDLIKLCSSVNHGGQYKEYNDVYKPYYMLDDPDADYYVNKRVHKPLTTMSQNNNQGFGFEENDGEVFANDDTNIIFQANAKPIRKNKYDLYDNYNTQIFGLSGKMQANTQHKNKYHVPFCNINKLKQENTNNKCFVVDKTRPGLRNDYYYF